jgi:legumain
MVTPDNFLAILKGQSSATLPKVLQSDENSKVFIYFADHGATGLVAFPSDMLYADDLNDAINYMNTNKMYKELVFYMEACESGSMFQGLLKDNINVYATTASSAYESSYAAYCSPQDKVNGVHIGSCLGDLYSVNWMENTDSVDSSAESLQD